MISTDDHDPYYDDTVHFRLEFELPDDMSDEALLFLWEMFQDFASQLDRCYSEQIGRALRARQLGFEEFLRERDFVDPQLSLPLDRSIDGEPF